MGRPTQSRLRLSDPGPDAIISHDGRPQKLRALFGDVAEMTVSEAMHSPLMVMHEWGWFGCMAVFWSRKFIDILGQPRALTGPMAMLTVFASGLMLLILPCPMKVWALVAWPDTVPILSMPTIMVYVKYSALSVSIFVSYLGLVGA